MILQKVKKLGSRSGETTPELAVSNYATTHVELKKVCKHFFDSLLKRAFELNDSHAKSTHMLSGAIFNIVLGIL